MRRVVSPLLIGGTLLGACRWPSPPASCRLGWARTRWWRCGPRYTIDWSHRRVAWLVLRPLSELNAAAALEAAAERLRKSDAGVKPDPAGATLHFWCVSRTRRSWLACISNGRVDAAPVGDQLSVTVGAGLRPVAIYGAVAALIGTC